MQKQVKFVKELFPRTKEFLSETRAEWKKVTKPPRREVIQTTVVVVVTSFVFAAYLAFADLVIGKVYSWTMDLLGM